MVHPLLMNCDLQMCYVSHKSAFYSRPEVAGDLIFSPFLKGNGPYIVVKCEFFGFSCSPENLKKSFSDCGDG